jgi:predicted ester cyclase
MRRCAFTAARGAARSGKERTAMRRHAALVSVVAMLFLGGMATAGGSAGAQDATPAACPTLTEEETATLFDQHYEALAAREDVSSYFAEEYVVHLSTGRDQQNGQPEWFRDRQADFPDMTLTPHVVIIQDDMVAVYEMWSGTQQDPIDVLGAPATGQYADWPSTVIYRLECGKIVEMWTVADNLDMLRDLGVITAEELQSAESVATPTP